MTTDFFDNDPANRRAYVAAIMDMVSSWEGGYSNHRADRGGETRYGVTLAAWRGQGGSQSGFNNLTREGAQQFFEEHYFNAIPIDQTDPALWPIMTDIAVNSGTGRPFDLLQDTLHRAGYIDTPGETSQGWTPALRAAHDRFIADHGSTELAQGLAARRLQYYQEIIENNPSQREFESGWNRRGMATAPATDMSTFDGAMSAVYAAHNGENPQVPARSDVQAYIGGNYDARGGVPIPARFDAERFERGINQAYAAALSLQITELEARDPATLSEEETAQLTTLRERVAEFGIDVPQAGESGDHLSDMHYALIVSQVSGLIDVEVSADDINGTTFGESTQAAAQALVATLEERGIENTEDLQAQLPQMAEELSAAYNRNIRDYRERMLAEEDRANRDASRVRDMMAALPDETEPEDFLSMMFAVLMAHIIGRPDLAEQIWSSFNGQQGGVGSGSGTGYSAGTGGAPSDSIRGQYTPNPDAPELRSQNPHEIIGQRLDLDMSLLQPNANGIALVVSATGPRQPGVPGVVMAVDVNTGLVVDAFNFIGGGAGPASELATNGITPGLTGENDFDSHPDITARWGITGISYTGRSHWTDSDGVTWHIQTDDPLASRNAMWIHPSSGSTFGCLGMRPGDDARFRRFFESQPGLAEMVFVEQEVLTRSIEAARNPEPALLSGLSPADVAEVGAIRETASLSGGLSGSAEEESIAMQIALAGATLHGAGAVDVADASAEDVESGATDLALAQAELARRANAAEHDGTVLS